MMGSGLSFSIVKLNFFEISENYLNLIILFIFFTQLFNINFWLVIKLIIIQSTRLLLIQSRHFLYLYQVSLSRLLLFSSDYPSRYINPAIFATPATCASSTNQVTPTPSLLLHHSYFALLSFCHCFMLISFTFREGLSTCHHNQTRYLKSMIKVTVTGGDWGTSLTKSI